MHEEEEDDLGGEGAEDGVEAAVEGEGVDGVVDGPDDLERRGGHGSEEQPAGVEGVGVVGVGADALPGRPEPGDDAAQGQQQQDVADLADELVLHAFGPRGAGRGAVGGHGDARRVDQVDDRHRDLGDPVVADQEQLAVSGREDEVSAVRATPVSTFS